MTRTLLIALALALPTTALGADRYAGSIDEGYLGTTSGGTDAFEVLPLDSAGQAIGGGALAFELSTPVLAPAGFSSADGWDSTGTLVAAAASQLDPVGLALLQDEAFATGEAIDLDAALTASGAAVSTIESRVRASWTSSGSRDAVPGVVDLLVMPPVDVLESAAPSPDQDWFGDWLDSYPSDMEASHLLETEDTVVIVMASDSSELMLAIIATPDQITWQSTGYALDGLYKGFEVLLDEQEIPSRSFEGGESQSEQAETTSSSGRCTDPRGCR